MKLSKNNHSPSHHADEENQSDEGAKKSIDPKLLGLAVGAVLGVIIAVILSYLVYDNQVVKNRQAQLEEFTQLKANITGESIAHYFENIAEKAEFIASQKLFRDALIEGDRVVLAGAERSYKRELKGVESVQIFKLGEAAVDPNNVPPIRFSELSLIQAAEKGKPSTVEGVNINGNWLLHVIVPARENKETEPEGVVWVSTNAKPLLPLLKQDNEGLGRVELYQKFTGNSRPLVSALGEADLSVSAVSNVGDTHWEVQFTASSNLYAQTHVDTVVIYLILFGIVLVSVSACTYTGFFVGNKLYIAEHRREIEGKMRLTNVQVKAGQDYVDPMYQPTSLMDVKISKEDESLLGLEDDEEESESAEALSLDDDVFELGGLDDDEETGFPAEVFRAYDIRGVAHSQIDKEFALSLGKALGSELLELNENTLVVARDARTHSPELTEWLIRGVLSTGCNVLNIGTVPTPLMYFTIETMEEMTSGVMVTASHNGAEYNGFKIVLNGVSRSEDDIQAIRRRMNVKRFLDGQGSEHHHDILPNYIDTIFSDVALAGEMSVVVDAGNGVAGKVAPQLFEELGCRVTPLYCDLDGTFPNHNPDPSVPANLKDLIAKVQEEKADIGVALDGDGDRVAVVSRTGKIYFADRLLMLFAKDIISRAPGADVIFDVKSTRHLNACIATHGGRPIMWKTGHSLMKQKMLETGAMVGAEYSGHIFIKDRWFGFDDGMYAAARLLEILSLQGESIDEAFAEFPESVSTQEYRVHVDESKKFSIIEQLKESANFEEGRITNIDGIRADFSYGWGLIRASNTGPELTMRFEADDEASIHKLKSLFIKELRIIDNTIEVNWNQ